MLHIKIPSSEFYNEAKGEFVYVKEQTLSLEHSLVSLSKWESLYHKPFLGTRKTPGESRDYVRCMTLTQNVDPLVYYGINDEILARVEQYIRDPMTATTFYNRNAPPNNKTITAEVIYYSMIIRGIPFECQKWHLNRLLTLIRVFDMYSSGPQKMSSSELARHNSELNRARRRALGSKG